MKIIQSAKVCKSCQKPVEEAAVVELKTIAADGLKKPMPTSADASTGDGVVPGKAAGGAGLTEKTPASGPEKKSGPAGGDSGITFDDLVEGGLSETEDGSSFEQMEVVRDTGDDKPPEPGIKMSRGSGGLAHINIIEKAEPTGFVSSNFQRRVLPRLIQIFMLLLLIAFISAGVFIYNVMDLPEYYNSFHMRMENSKSFGEALIQLNVCENARQDVKLGFQVSEIEKSFKNSYVMWKVIVSQVTPITSDPLSKHTYVLMAKPDRLAKSPHFIRMYMNAKMIGKIKRKPFVLKEERSMTVSGRIIAWARSRDRQSLEIELYDAEIVEGY